MSDSNDYNDGNSKLKYICPKGHNGTIGWGNFRQGIGCSTCNESKGEKIIREFLNKNKIIFEEQKTFDDCRNPNTKRKLFFDFYIPQSNFLIEYDGVQHCKPWFGMTKDDLANYKFRDSIKTKYSKNNNINLLRISHIKFDYIEKILSENMINLANVVKK